MERQEKMLLRELWSSPFGSGSVETFINSIGISVAWAFTGRCFRYYFLPYYALPRIGSVLFHPSHRVTSLTYINSEEKKISPYINPGGKQNNFHLYLKPGESQKHRYK